MNMRQRLLTFALGLPLLLLASTAGASFYVGDLVFCDANANGIFDPGESPLDGIEVRAQCTNAAGVACLDQTTTTGSPDFSALPEGLGAVFPTCAPALTWLPQGFGADWSGRYLFDVGGLCTIAGAPPPWTCTITVNEDSLPPDCNVAVTPRSGGNPFDNNFDGDACDAGDGPFPEGQPIGNAAFEGGCNSAPDPLPTTNQYITTLGVSDFDRCSLHNDFGYTKDVDESGPTRTPGFWKNHPGAIDNYLPFEFCGAVVEDACSAVELLSARGGGINQFTRHGVAAILNCSAWGCSDEIEDLIEAGSEACAAGTAFDYGAAGTELDIFNNSGDDLGQNPPNFNVDKKRCK